MQWGIESVAALAAAQADAAFAGNAQTSGSTGTAAPDAFANLMQRELGELNNSVGAAETAMRDLAAGKPVELHDVMISLERARISVQTFVQVRNKLVESYQDLMRMQL
ncbi:MAG: flagellar hook-basal body complex protein FliE [Rhizobacter sp.]